MLANALILDSGDRYRSHAKFTEVSLLVNFPKAHSYPYGLLLIKYWIYSYCSIFPNSQLMLFLQTSRNFLTQHWVWTCQWNSWSENDKWLQHYSGPGLLGRGRRWISGNAFQSLHSLLFWRIIACY